MEVLFYRFDENLKVNASSLSQLWEHVTRLMGRWTQDQKVWGPIPTVCHVWKCRANFPFHTESGYPIVMGTLYLLGTEITEVDLFAFAYRLFHEDFSPISLYEAIFLNLLSVLYTLA